MFIKVSIFILKSETNLSETPTPVIILTVALFKCSTCICIQRVIWIHHFYRIYIRMSKLKGNGGDFYMTIALFSFMSVCCSNGYRPISWYVWSNIYSTCEQFQERFATFTSIYISPHQSISCFLLFTIETLPIWVYGEDGKYVDLVS